MRSREVLPTDVDSVARTIAAAFAGDPVWAPALSRTDRLRIDLEPYWRLFIEGAMRFGTARVYDDGAATSIWLPPAAAELSDAQAQILQHFLDAFLDPPALSALHELYDRFETSRRSRPPHYYLSLLATNPEHRGKGVGQALLAEDLSRWDEMGIAAYLESTNPANDHRYERAGFRHDGGFRAVRNDVWVSAMWRPIGGSLER